MIYYIETKCRTCDCEEAMLSTCTQNPTCGKCGGEDCVIAYQKEQPTSIKVEEDAV